MSADLSSRREFSRRLGRPREVSRDFERARELSVAYSSGHGVLFEAGHVALSLIRRDALAAIRAIAHSCPDPLGHHPCSANRRVNFPTPKGVFEIAWKMLKILRLEGLEAFNKRVSKSLLGATIGGK